MRYIYEDIEQGKVSKDIPCICSCGGLLMINDNNTRISCSNANCSKRMSDRLKKAFNKLGIYANIGTITSETILEFYDLKNPMEIFKSKLMQGEIAGNTTYSEKVLLRTISENLIKEYKRVVEKGIHLWRVIDAIDLPSIGTTRAQDIFQKYDDICTFYKDFEGEKAKLIGSKINISPYSDTVNSIVRELEFNKDFIIEIVHLFNITKVNKNVKSYTIGITGAITTIRDESGKALKPRERIAEVLGKLYGASIKVTRVKDTNFDYLIMDDNRMTANNKFNHLKDKGNLDKVVTAYEFEEIVAKETNNEIPMNRRKGDFTWERN